MFFEFGNLLCFKGLIFFLEGCIMCFGIFIIVKFVGMFCNIIDFVLMWILLLMVMLFNILVLVFIIIFFFRVG